MIEGVTENRGGEDVMIQKKRSSAILSSNSSS